jgi:hypothetical protein
LYVSFALILSSENPPSPFGENMVAGDKVCRLIELLLLLEYIIDQNLVLMDECLSRQKRKKLLHEVKTGAKSRIFLSMRENCLAHDERELVEKC